MDEQKKPECTESPAEDNFDIPQWQIEKVRESIKYTEQNPGSLRDWATVKDNIKRK